MATHWLLSWFALMFTEYNLVSIAWQVTWKGNWQQLSTWCLGRNTWEAPVFFLRGYQLMGDRRVKLNSSANKQAYFYQKHISSTANCYSINPHPITGCRAGDFVQQQWPLCRHGVMSWEDSRSSGLVLSQAVNGPGSVALGGCLRCWTGNLWIEKLIFLAKGVQVCMYIFNIYCCA